MLLSHKTDKMEFTIKVHAGYRAATLTIEKQPRGAYEIDSFIHRRVCFESLQYVEAIVTCTNDNYNARVFILGSNGSKSGSDKRALFKFRTSSELFNFITRLYTGMVTIGEMYEN